MEKPAAIPGGDTIHIGLPAAAACCPPVDKAVIITRRDLALCAATTSPLPK